MLAEELLFFELLFPNKAAFADTAEKVAKKEANKAIFKDIPPPKNSNLFLQSLDLFLFLPFLSFSFLFSVAYTFKI